MNAVNISNLEKALRENNEKLKQWTVSKIGEIETLKFDWGGVLPTTDIPTNVIYMIPSDGGKEGNVYDEYVYDSVNSKWETLGKVDVGSVQIDPYTEAEITAMVNELWGITSEGGTEVEGGVTA